MHCFHRAKCVGFYIIVQDFYGAPCTLWYQLVFLSIFISGLGLGDMLHASIDAEAGDSPFQKKLKTCRCFSSYDFHTLLWWFVCTNKRATNPQSDTWNLICKAKVLSKVKVFGWKLSTDSLGINCRRNIDHVPTCHICGVEAELGSAWKQRLFKLQHSRRTQMLLGIWTLDTQKKAKIVQGLKPAASRRIQSSGLSISVRLGAAGLHPPTSPHRWARITQPCRTLQQRCNDELAPAGSKL